MTTVEHVALVLLYARLKQFPKAINIQSTPMYASNVAHAQAYVRAMLSIQENNQLKDNLQKPLAAKWWSAAFLCSLA